MSDDAEFDERVRSALRESDDDPVTESLLSRSADEWVISRSLGHLLTRLVSSLNRRSILEFGAGLSSLVLASALSRSGGGRLTSVEHQPEFCREHWKVVESTPNVDAVLAPSRLRLGLSRHGLMYGYPDARGVLRTRAPYDLVVIDAPPGQFGRDNPLYAAYAWLAPDTVIVVDDAARAGERTAIRRWLDTFPGLRLLTLDAGQGRGTAILVHDGDKRRRLSARAIAGTVHDRLTGAHR